MARATYDPEVKAAVIAALLAGQGALEIAKTYRIPEGTVRAWRARTKGVPAVAEGVVAKREEIGDMIVAFLGSSIKTLIAMQAVLGDPKWLREQSAAEMGPLFGIMTDKVFRMLEALGGPNPAPASEAPAEPVVPVDLAPSTE